MWSVIMTKRAVLTTKPVDLCRRKLKVKTKL